MRIYLLRKKYLVLALGVLLATAILWAANLPPAAAVSAPRETESPPVEAADSPVASTFIFVPADESAP